MIKEYNKDNNIESYKNSSYYKLKNKIGNKINELVIVKVHHTGKNPIQNEWNKIKKTDFESLKNHNGNIGIIFNPKNKYKYSFIDIDGFKEKLGEDTNKEFKHDLYKIFENNKNIMDYSAVQKTQSGGYHLIFKYQENAKINNNFINQFRIPKELKNKYKINKEYFGDGSKSGAIEIFINIIKACVVYPSEYKDRKSGKIKKYDIIHVGDKFGEPIKNIKKELENCFGKIKTPQEPKRNIKVNNNYDVEPFKNDDNVFNLMVEEFKEQEGNHNYILGIYTSILLYIGLSGSETIEYMLKIFNKAGDNTKEHRKQIESYIDGNDGRYPKYKDLNNNRLKKALDSYFKTNMGKNKIDIKTITPFLDISINRWTKKKDKEVFKSLESLPIDINLNKNIKEHEGIFEEIEKVKDIIINSKNQTDKKTAVKTLQEKIKVIEVSYNFKHDKNVQNLLIYELSNYEKNNENIDNLIIAIYTTIQKILPTTESINYMLKLLDKSKLSNEYNENTILQLIKDNKYSEIKINTYFDNTDLIIILKSYLEKINENNLIDKYIQLANTNNTEKIQILAEILENKLNVGVRKNIGDIYILDDKSNVYIKITNDELLYKLTNYIGKKYIISKDNIEKSIDYLYNRIEPSFKHIKLNNCIINMDTAKKIEPNEPILCSLNIPYDYNPEAESELVDDYLESSLKDTDKETTNKKIQGLYEILGYLLTSGNKEEILFILVGKKGGGKSVLGQIITALVGGTQNTCDIKLNELSYGNPHNTSAFVNAHLNIIQEQDKKPIKNTGVIKQITGNDSIMVNPKNKDLKQLRPEEVPKTVIMCNNPPDLTEDEALTDRIVTLQFKNSFRNTKKQIKGLDKKIIENKEAMEYILYKSLKAYEPIAQGKKELTLREDEKTRKELLEKNTNPISYYIEKLVEVDEDVKVPNSSYDIEPYNVSSIKLKELIKKGANKEGVQIPTGKNGLPNVKFKPVFDKIFDTDDDYFTSKSFTLNGKRVRIYNHLKFKDWVCDIL